MILIDVISQGLSVHTDRTTMIAHSSGGLDMSTFHVFTDIGLILGLITTIFASPDCPTPMAFRVFVHL